MRFFLLPLFLKTWVNSLFISMGRDVLLLSLIGHVVLARSDEVSAIKLKYAAPTILKSKFIGRTCPFIKLEGFERLREKERTEESNRSNRSMRPLCSFDSGTRPRPYARLLEKRKIQVNPRVIYKPFLGLLQTSWISTRHSMRRSSIPKHIRSLAPTRESKRKTRQKIWLSEL